MTNTADREAAVLKSEMCEILYQDNGDYFERCFPKTYVEFTTRVPDSDSGNSVTFDLFDLFIAEKFPFFRLLIRKYYDAKRDNRLQLKSIASNDRLERMDDLLLEHLTRPNDKLYRAIEGLYILILEEYVIREVLKK